MSSEDRSHNSSHRRHRRDSHSTSYSHSRRNSYTDNSYSDYSDSFYSEDESDKKSIRNHSKTKGKKINNKIAVSKGRGKPTAGRNSKALTSPRGTDYITKRMLSARRMKINELRSENENLLHQIEELKKENKTLLHQQRLAEKQLERYEGQENDIPGLIKRHAEEVRTLREQLRRQKEKYQKTDRKLIDTEDELSRTKRLLKKLKGLVEDKHLKERDELSQKLSKVEAELDEKTRKIQQLEHHIENLMKNHRHELGIERARHKETAQKLQEVSEERQRLQTLLKEKEKELEIKNIYSNRVMRPPHKLNSSVSSSPLPETGRPPRPRARKNSTPSNMTPRERVKQFEEHRRHEMRRLAERPHKPPIRRPDDHSSSLNTDQRTEANDREDKHSVTQRQNRNTLPAHDTKQTKHLLDDEHNAGIQFSFQSHQPNKPSNTVKRSELPSRAQRTDNADGHKKTLSTEHRQAAAAVSLARERREDDSQEVDERQIQRIREEEERIRHESEMKQKRNRRKKDDKENDESYWKPDDIQDNRYEMASNEDDSWIHQQQNTREKEERERREQEEREHWQREEQERKEREKEERERKEREEEERERKERERKEHERREREEIERRAEEERNRLANEAAERERRRQKDLLLAKMKAIDESKTQEENDPFFIPEARKSEKKDYKFTQPVENMYQGKPAYDNVSGLEQTKKKGLQDDDDIIGYQPSFTSKSSPNKQRRKNNLQDTDTESNSSAGKQNTTQPQKKADLLENLFGSSGSTKPQAGKQTSSTALFGGGSSALDDESPPLSSSHLLPRRSRQPASTLSRPVISAIDDIEDDIEEVVL